MWLLFVPAIINIVIGWGIWYWLYEQTGSVDAATRMFQNYVAWYVPLILILLLPIYWKRLRGLLPEGETLWRPSGRGFLTDGFVAVLWAGVVVLVTLLWWKLTGTTVEVYPLASTATAWIQLIGMVIIAPIVEELIFRGVGFFLAEKRGWSFVKGAFITSVAFALWHANWYLFVPAFIFGWITYWLMHQYRTLLVTVLTHAVANGAMYTMMYAFPV